MWLCFAGSRGRQSVKAIASIRFDLPSIISTKKELTAAIRTENRREIEEGANRVLAEERLEVLEFNRNKLTFEISGNATY